MVKNIDQLIRTNILNLAPYSSAREEYPGKDGVFLDANEMPFGIFNRYPDPYQLILKRRIAEIKNSNIDTIFIGNGSDEVIDIAFRIFCNPGKDKALTFFPTYGMYDVAANINDVQLIKLPLNNEFQIDVPALVPYLNDKNLKLIFICSPNNPTGNLIPTEDISFILENFNGIVLLDEAYIDFSNQKSFIDKINIYPHLIVSQTLSKAWGMAGIRLGVAYMNQQILSYYNKVKAPYNISSVNQLEALKLLTNVEETQQQIQDILVEKQKMQKELENIKTVRKVYPSDTNFFLVEVEDADQVYDQLIKQHIIVRNRNSVVKNCIRITIGTVQENQKLINALKKINNG